MNILIRYAILNYPYIHLLGNFLRSHSVFASHLNVPNCDFLDTQKLILIWSELNATNWHFQKSHNMMTSIQIYTHHWNEYKNYIKIIIIGDFLSSKFIKKIIITFTFFYYYFMYFFELKKLYFKQYKIKQNKN